MTLYETLASFAQTWGLALFMGMFLIALVYALRPANTEKFRRAADMPLIDKEPSDE